MRGLIEKMKGKERKDEEESERFIEIMKKKEERM